VSHRSGETEDSTIADIAVATSATAVQAVIPEYQKSKAVIRRFCFGSP